jgi:two-component system CheB/CheR fusion protein
MEELQATSNDMSSLLTSTDIAVIFLDMRLRIRRFTPAVRSLFELISADAGRPLGDFAKKFVDPELMNDARAVLDRLVPVEREVMAEGGRWFVRRVLPYRTNDNRIDGVVITFVETTSRKRTERALAERARLLDLSNDAIIVHDTSGRIVYWNHGAATLYGWSAAEAIGKDMDELLRPETDVTLEELTHQLREKDQLTKEAVHVARDGRRVPVLCRWALDRDAEGRPGAMLMTATDVSDRRRAQEVLCNSESRLRRVFEAVDVVGVLFFDNEGRLVDCNDAFLRTQGIDRADVAGGRVKWSNLTPSEWKQRSEQAWAELQATGRTTPYVKEYVKTDGSRWWGLFAAARIDPGMIVEYVIDVTATRRDEDVERSELLSRERAARAEAEAANETKDEFLAMLSHELRTPLSAILLWSKMLHGKQIPPEQHVEALHAVITSAEALRELVETLLDSARIRSGKLRLSLREVQLLPLVREALDAIAPTAGAKSLKLRTAGMEDVGLVVADPDRLRQVVWNLLTNSVKFTPPGGEITVGLARQNGEVELAVTDTGRGIEPSFMPHLFHRFQQGTARAPGGHMGGGLGLGLSISKQLVELHGGTITAESEGPGKGATFRVRLPLPRVEGAQRAGRAPRPAADRLKGVRVLLVEDDAATMTALTRLLVAAGAEVTTATSGLTALEAYGRQRPDVIVSDIGMTGMDGYELIAAIRERESAAQHPAAPAVALTALAQETDRRKAKQHGYQEHVAKPPDPQRLVEVIGRVVRKK